MSRLKINPGEYICSKCKGKRKIPIEEDHTRLIGIIGTKVTCPTCHGTGKLDWIEKIVGKKQPRNISLKLLMQDMAKEAAQRLVEDIDKEFLDSILKEI